MILSNISGQHLNCVEVRLRIAFLYILRKNVSCVTHHVPTKMFWVVPLICYGYMYKAVIHRLERTASNEYPLQTFSLRNKKIELWVSIALDQVLNSLYCKDILASDNRRNMKIEKWWGLVHPHESL